MLIQQEAPTAEQQSLLDRVMGYHHEPLVRRLEQKEGWSRQEAEAVFMEMKRFLYLCGTKKGPFAPTERIDAAWHHFILFTLDYMNFSQKFFGRYIHHQPRIEGDPPDATIVPRTLAAARETFGVLSPNWDFRVKKQCQNCDADPGPGEPCASGLTASVDCGFSDCSQCNDTNCQNIDVRN